MDKKLIDEGIRKLSISTKLSGITIRLMRIEQSLKEIEKYKSEIYGLVGEISRLNKSDFKLMED